MRDAADTETPPVAERAGPQDLTFTLNGSQVTTRVRPWDRLLDVLRGPLGHTGTKAGCGEGECGACTVLVEGRPVNSCLYPALEIEGREVTTIEGLAPEAHGLSILQEAFVTAGGVQCGFCTPGFVMTAHALLASNPDPTDDEIRTALSGNLCRCTGYVQIVAAVREAAAARRGGTA